ncbi:YlxR family protein [Kribbella sp. NPDC020789]
MTDARPGKARERTCIGCRKRSSPADLLRATVSGGLVLPDPGRRAPGRGAHVHPTLECLELAVRRKAFPRAFRVPGPLDVTGLREFLAQRDRQEGHTAATRPSAAVHPDRRDRHEGGSSTHDHSMSVYR